MREPTCPLNGIRRYGRADVVRLRFIKRAQQGGFALNEIESAWSPVEQPAARRALSPHRSSQRSRSGHKRRELLKGWGEVRGIEEYYVDPAALAPCVT